MAIQTQKYRVAFRISGTPIPLFSISVWAQDEEKAKFIAYRLAYDANRIFMEASLEDGGDRTWKGVKL